MEILVPLLVNLGAAALIYILLRRRIDVQYSQKAFLDKIQKEIGQIVTEMNQTTERNIQLLENKLEALKSLSERAQNLITRGNSELHSLQDRYQQIGSFSRPSLPAVRPTVKEQARVLPEGEATGRLTGKPAQSSEPDPQARVSPEEAGNSLQKEGNKDKSRDRRKQEATELYIRGEDLDRIAEQTGLSLGEVELIVALIRR